MTEIQQALTNVVLRSKQTQKHLDRCSGILHGDKQFWQEIFHDQTDEAYAEQLVIAERMLEEEYALCQKHRLTQEDVQAVRKRLESNAAVIIKHRKEYNLPVFRSWMSLHDCIKDLQGPKSKNNYRNLF
jgi:hypothetical protein